MRWEKEKEVKERIRKGFLFIPRMNLDGYGNKQWRWLEYAAWLQVKKSFLTFDYGGVEEIKYYWVNDGWLSL